MADSTNHGSGGDGPKTPADLRRIKLFAGLDDTVLCELYPRLEPRRMRTRASLNLAHDLEGRVGFAWSGRHRMTTMAPTGASVTMFSLQHGDVFGHSLAVLGLRQAHGVHFVTDQAGLILHMSSMEFTKLSDTNRSVSSALLQALAALSLDYGARVFELATLDVRARLQAELLRLVQYAQAIDGDLVITDAPTQAALGGQIGATREAVTRHMKDLTGEGVINFSRGVIEILDLNRLQDMDTAATGRMWRR